MKWSFRLFRVGGVGIYVHVTFFLLLIWVGVENFLVEHRWEDAVAGIIFILALFTIVVLHEFGHAMMARRFGVQTRDITLLPIGGVARLDRMPEDPKQELAIAIAGPAVNVLLAVLFFSVLAMQNQLAATHQFVGAGNHFLWNLVRINVVLAVFNLLPAFPMDGGRVLRALLATRMNYVRATNIAANVGQAMAFVFGIAGLFVNPLLVLVAVFVWMGAAQEAGAVQMRSNLTDVPVSRLMITDFHTLAPDEPLSRAVDQLLAAYQQDFPVVDNGKMVGLLTRPRLVDGLAQLGSDAEVSRVMDREFPSVQPTEPAETAFLKLQQTHSRALPVLREGGLLGILTSEHIGEFLMVRAALNGSA
ncbi:MAG TPA: site-2 protease family protein [Verrucomicrobiae bacterium]|nr:site-2 protease family protein [Verrucomicrobiae bacterium]